MSTVETGAGSLGEALLYRLARALYNTEIAHTEDMKASLSDMDSYDAFRASESVKMINQLNALGISLAGKRVVDFGCNDGSISVEYLRQGAASVTGVDIDAEALARARRLHTDPRLSFIQGGKESSSLAPGSADVVLSFDVLEHVEFPLPMLRDIFNALVPGGVAVVATIGWWMPFAPHLWSTMPVPWAHVFFSELTVLRTCQRVYHSPWYRPTMHDLDAAGSRLPDKFTGERIDRAYLNHFLVRDFEQAFQDTGFSYQTHILPLGGMRILRPLLRAPVLRELLGSSVWFTLRKPQPTSKTVASAS